MKRHLADLSILVGVSLTTRGLWMIYPPAAYVALGLLITFLAVWGQRTK